MATLDRLVSDVPAPALRTALADAVSAAEAGMGVRVVRSVAGEAEGEPASTVIAMLEAADRAEAAIHGLDGAELAAAGTTPANGTSAFASGWLRARSAELAAGMGGRATALHAAAVMQQAEGRVLEAEDLFDAARPVGRYIDAARLRTGALFSLAAALGAEAAGAVGEGPDRLAIGARSAGIAAKIQRDVTGFVSRFVAGGAAASSAPGGALSNGVYSMPVIRAVEAEPKIASALGGPVAGEDLIELVGRIRDAGGLARAAEDCREFAEAAKAELAGIENGAGLAEMADEAAAAAEEAARR